MIKIRNGKYKFYLKVLSILLIFNMIIGYFPRCLAIADTVIGSDTDTINDVDVVYTSIPSDTNADYLGNVTFYNYYGKYQTSDITDNNDNDHYSFERFNRAISDYASSTAMEYPLYFGDFNGAANNSNNPEQNPLQGQTLGGSAYRFYWAINRANRNANYSASLQGLVSEKLDSEGYITQNSTGGFIVTDENSKKYDYNNRTIIGSGDTWIKNEDINGRSGSLQVGLAGKQEGTICERLKISANENDYSANSRYLTFEIYNIGQETSGSPYVSIEDKNGNKIGGWSQYFATEYSDNKMPTSATGWKRIIIDLNKLKGNANFDFANIANMYLGYWADGSNNNHFYINDIRFVGEIESSVVRLPYFDESFVSGNVGETINDLKFPFKKRLKGDTYYYTFSSGKSGYQINNKNITDVVRINRVTNNLDYWFDVNDYDNSNIVRDMKGTNGWGTGSNEPGFFPFNNPGDSSNVSKLNYGFGAKIEIQFKLTADGKVKNIHGQDVPIEFNFKGDDDVWVYVDGQLALDMGGAHSQTTGKIDFASRKSTVDNVVIGDLKSNSLYQPVKSVTTDLKLSDDSYTTDGKYDTNKVHTLTLFYMERGMIESNLYMDFNFIPSENELIVEKEVDTTGVNNILASKTQEIANNINFGFNISENGTPKQNLDYKLTIGEKLEDKNMNGDTFELKNTNKATFYNKFSKGSNVVVSEKADNRFTTTWITKKLSDNEEVVLGQGTGTQAGALNIPQDTSLYEKYIYYAKFINKINTGTLSINKDIALLEGDNLNNYKDDIFDFKVTFTSILGTKLDTPIEHNIQLKAGETIEITGIPVGTEYEVEEILKDELENKLENKYDVNQIKLNSEVYEGQEKNVVTGQITSNNSTHEIIYINEVVVRDLIIKKVDITNESNVLKGAEFTLEKLNDDLSVDSTFKKLTATSGENGQATFNNLPYGKYRLTETKAPDGYELLREPIVIEIGATKSKVIYETVGNKKIIELPSTGGSGRNMFTTVGIAIICSSLLMYILLELKKKYSSSIK